LGSRYVRDVLAPGGGLELAPVRGFVKPAFYVRDADDVSALARMRTRNLLALVVDEYGGSRGS
jgi:CBS domain containing-hemolysin-like protein